MPAGAARSGVYQQNCQVVPRPDRLGTDGGVPLVHAAADPANNIAAGAPRFDAARFAPAVTAGKGRMPAFPHLTPADVENLVAFLTTAPGGRARGVAVDAGAALARGFGRTAGTDRRIRIGVDAADAPGGRGRGALPPYPGRCAATTSVR